jgi:hypothetical protein
MLQWLLKMQRLAHGGLSQVALLAWQPGVITFICYVLKVLLVETVLAAITFEGVPVLGMVRMCLFARGELY